jgi:hypothetical protein
MVRGEMALFLTSVQTIVLSEVRILSRIFSDHPSEAHDQIFIIVRQLQVCWCGAPSLTRGWVCCLQLLLLGPCPVRLMTIFYCLRFETSPTWRVRSPYLCPFMDIMLCCLLKVNIPEGRTNCSYPSLWKPQILHLYAFIISYMDM